MYKYSKKEKELFWQQVNSGKPAEKIRIPRRDKKQVWRKLRELGLTVKRGFPTLTRAQRKKLRKFAAKGFTAKQIAQNQMLGEARHLASANYIQKWMGRLRLVNKNRSRAAKKRRLFKPAESRGLNRFIVLHSSELSARQIAEKYGIKPGTVSSRQRHLGVKPNLAEAMRLPETRRKFLAGMQKRSAKILVKFPEHIAELENKLNAIAKKIRQNHNAVPIEEKLCLECKKFWPRYGDFFFRRKYRLRRGTGVSFHFSSPCKICMAKKRHQKRL